MKEHTLPYLVSFSAPPEGTLPYLVKEDSFSDAIVCTENANHAGGTLNIEPIYVSLSSIGGTRNILPISIAMAVEED